MLNLFNGTVEFCGRLFLLMGYLRHKKKSLQGLTYEPDHIL